MLIHGCEIEGRGPLDVRILGERIAEIATRLPRILGERVIDAAGGALLPGLHDHHIHLLSLAASLASLPCGPPQARNRDALADALRHAPGEGWIRGVGYHESVAGDLDRRSLDDWVGQRPARVQHRSGRLWILSSEACRRVGLDADDGRLFDGDAWLRGRLPRDAAPDLAPVGERLARLGVTGVSDATASNGPEEAAILAAAVARGALPQRLRVMGGDMLTIRAPLARGELKIVLHESAPPPFGALVACIAGAHERSRAVAIHCVTHAELLLALAALEEAGVHSGDRIEHASLAPPECVKRLAELRVAVVTQPGFLFERGDAYLAEVEPHERRWLYRGRGFLDAGVALGGGSDAPFGDPDPWRAMRAAVERRSESGAVLFEEETLTSEEALALFTTPPHAPGGSPRRLAPGADADLCLLDRPWREARGSLCASHVRAVLRAGRLIHGCDVA